MASTNRAMLAASVGALIAIGAPLPASAAPAGAYSAQVAREVAGRADDLGRFYAARGYADRGATTYTFDGESFANRLFARRLS